MNLEQAKELLSKEVKALIKKNGSMKSLEFTFALVGLFRSKPDTLKAFETIEKEIGEDAANELVATFFICYFFIKYEITIM